jgi:hypothetical protein
MTGAPYREPGRRPVTGHARARLPRGSRAAAVLVWAATLYRLSEALRRSEAAGLWVTLAVLTTLVLGGVLSESRREP